ncbi:MAG: asparagine synthetase B [Saprospiraceae bacterium]|nr:asparagine synthetase B [Saprospiraceae bacterium]
MRRLIIAALLAVFAFQAQAAYLLLPMDHESQRDHLKAYGITYWVLQNGAESWWLLNYRGGSFAFKHNPIFEKECITRGVTYEVIADAQFNQILEEIAHPEVNMDAIKLEVAPKVAVYSPKQNEQGIDIQPWDDAVTLALTYAEIPYDVIYDEEVVNGELAKYDWLHLHHEDFTGQYGRFYRRYVNQPWYREHVRQAEETAKKLGFAKVSQLKLAVVKNIKEYVGGGGFMFAMCSAADTYDIALAAEGIDICGQEYDGDGVDPDAQEKLNFTKTFAFRDFELSLNVNEFEHASIDNSRGRRVSPDQDYFSLFDFSAKWDPVPTMLTQNHTRTVKGFMGQTTAFRKEYIKSNVLTLGDNKPAGESRYIHGTFGEGTWTFYGGHDPEDYRHHLEDPPTDLSLHPNSPGYRLILNNILFPAAKKKQRKT